MESWHGKRCKPRAFQESNFKVGHESLRKFYSQLLFRANQSGQQVVILAILYAVRYLSS